MISYCSTPGAQATRGRLARAVLVTRPLRRSHQPSAGRGCGPRPGQAEGPQTLCEEEVRIRSDRPLQSLPLFPSPHGIAPENDRAVRCDGKSFKPSPLLSSPPAPWPASSGSFESVPPRLPSQVVAVCPLDPVVVRAVDRFDRSSQSNFHNPNPFSLLLSILICELSVGRTRQRHAGLAHSVSRHSLCTQPASQA